MTNIGEFFRCISTDVRDKRVDQTSESTTLTKFSRLCTIQYNTIQFINARRVTRKGNYYNLTIHFPKYVLISSKLIQSSF